MENQKDGKTQSFHDGLEKKETGLSSFSNDNLDRNETEHDLDSFEPQEFAVSDGVINTDDPHELRYWAEQFQVSVDELRSAALLEGNSIRKIKRYLSV